MIVRLLPEAERDLDRIFDYIAVDSPKAARAVVARIRRRLESLRDLPEQGVPVTRNRRRLIVSGTPYVVYYRMAGDTVYILRVFHGRHRRP